MTPTTRSLAATTSCAALVLTLLAAAPAAGAGDTREGGIQTASSSVVLPAAVKAATKTKKRVSVAGTKCTVFPDNNFWNTPITHLPVHKNSTKWRKAIGTRNLHPDFGPAGAGQTPYGIPVTVVDSKVKRVSVSFYYPSESDKVKYPLNAKTKIEGGKNASGDRHAIIVNKDNCRLYELFDVRQRGSKWTAGSGARWSLKSNKLRPAGWTSADAAGLAILPGLIRYKEVKAGRVDHAIRFTAPVTAKKYVWPARHQAGSRSASTHPPMGARFRLKKSFSEKGYSKDAKVIIRAMKTYGLVLADNGSGWFFQGEAHKSWKNKLMSELKTIPSSAFQAVDTKSLRVSKNSGKARQP